MSLPHGTIFLEPRLENFVTDAFKIFFETFADKNGWDLNYDSRATVDKFRGDILLINNMPVANWPHCGSDVSDALKFKGKLVVFLRDVHSRNNPAYVNEMRKLLDRADLILAFSDEYFRQCWPEYIGKFIWFPIYFGPTRRFTTGSDMPLMHRKRRCLVPGMTSQQLYPLRYAAAVNGVLKCDRIERHPNYGRMAGADGLCVREAYAEKLRAYCCCLTDGSIYNYFLQKHVEIPATGTLLLSNRFADLSKAGFKPWVHYIEVNEDNYQERVMAILENPFMYENIARAGRSLAESYSMENALDRFTKIMEEGHGPV